LLDADKGKLIVNPPPELVERQRGRLDEFRAAKRETCPVPGPPAETADGVAVTLLANTELPHELRAAKRCGAQGIGLFRSEFLFSAHPHGFPDMQTQVETYRMLAQEMYPYPVTIRTLDIERESLAAGAEISGPANPSMGLRGIRHSLRNKDLFAIQIEAILRASQAGKMEIVLPMISTVEELWQAREIIRNIQDRLARSHFIVSDSVPIGAMIEVPSAVLMLDSLCQEADFLCVGTNDLIQYTLAVDRSNPEVAHLFQPLHPAILQFLIRIAEVTRARGKPVRICGEISSNPFIAALLLGMGFTHLSMNAYALPTIRKVLNSLSIDTARGLVERARTCATAREIADILIEELPRMVKIDLTPYVKEIRSPDDHPRLSHVS
jgi:phosphotransferase system enzyme I (PtsI)